MSMTREAIKCFYIRCMKGKKKARDMRELFLFQRGVIHFSTMLQVLYLMIVTSLCHVIVFSEQAKKKGPPEASLFIGSIFY